MAKLPVLIPSCTLTSSGAIRVNEVAGGGGASTITVPAGRYWNDPSISTSAASSDTINALDQLAYLVLGYGAGTVGLYASGSVSVSGLTVVPKVAALFMSGADTLQILASNAATTDIGRKFLEYLGWDWYTDTAASNTPTAQGWAAYFRSPLAESGNTDEMSESMSAVVRLGGGGVYTADLGDPLVSRVVSLAALPGRLVNQREPGADNSSDSADSLAFRKLVWRWASRGELIRYYADSASTITGLSAALAKNANTCTVLSASGISAGTAICIDGEWCEVTNVASTTLTLLRAQPVAHPKYAPVSTDFVGTYALDTDGGNVNMRSFKPSRRAVNQDRWDMDIPLVRAVWS
jgi:hypothetical protein